jgi:iron complex transport system substrate-binding protein
LWGAVKAKIIAIGCVLLAGVSSARGAGSLRRQSDTTVKRSVREVTDEAGRTVRLAQPVERIVTLAPSLTETIYALGLDEHLVGDTDFCEYPADAKSKTKVGGTINPNIESIAALHPDVVLMTKTLNRLETVHALEGLHIPVYATDAHTVGEIIASTRKLAEALGYPGSAAPVVSDMERRLNDLHGRLADRRPKSVLFIVWEQPLISIGKDTFIADALRHAGAVSIVDSTQSWPQISLEEVVKLQPEYLVSAATHTGEGAVDPNALAKLPGWRSLTALQEGKFILVDESIDRPGPSIVEAIEQIARKLHPEAFRDKPQDLASASRPVGVPGHRDGGFPCSR